MHHAPTHISPYPHKLLWNEAAKRRKQQRADAEEKKTMDPIVIHEAKYFDREAVSQLKNNIASSAGLAGPSSLILRPRTRTEALHKASLMLSCCLIACC